jgi:hypothetical protein
MLRREAVLGDEHRYRRARGKMSGLMAKGLRASGDICAAVHVEDRGVRARRRRAAPDARNPAHHVGLVDDARRALVGVIG